MKAQPPFRNINTQGHVQLAGIVLMFPPLSPMGFVLLGSFAVLFCYGISREGWGQGAFGVLFGGGIAREGEGSAYSGYGFVASFWGVGTLRLMRAARIRCVTVLRST